MIGAGIFCFLLLSTVDRGIGTVRGFWAADMTNAMIFMIVFCIIHVGFIMLAAGGVIYIYISGDKARRDEWLARSQAEMVQHGLSAADKHLLLNQVLPIRLETERHKFVGEFYGGDFTGVPQIRLESIDPQLSLPQNHDGNVEAPWQAEQDERAQGAQHAEQVEMVYREKERRNGDQTGAA
ncbi:hypothetical protein MMYC01_210255 [Madurella mycetomatis]|uniref:Uncharacterized protein n=1 Tax=Madurella mycetomatis TaxID=100816 RepID=A0A175VNW4_9PEZI|nr:hypothetical protein MMYC01_210255 [Madurella mycetomatis]